MMGQQDELVSEMTSAMEVIQLPDDENDTTMADGSLTTSRYQPQQQRHHQQAQVQAQAQARQAPPPLLHPRPLVTPDRNQRRPLDDVIEAGAPASPIEFSRPRFERGRRDDVLCYNESTRNHDVARNVLFRDFSREFGDADGALHRVKQAYWPVPSKRPITTIMGHVEICIVLARCIRDSNDSSDDDGSSSSSSSDGGAPKEEEEEDIVFQVTNKYVAVKVNYCDRMDRLRDQHAEDPLKEIAAMQLIGNGHPNVMGTMEILFDGVNLNVVMPYCDSGDLFQLLQEFQARAPAPSVSAAGGAPPGPGMPEPQARYWFRQVMHGIQYLHSKGICHRDLSPENVMIDGTSALLIDMGMCLRIPYTDPKAPPVAGIDGLAPGVSVIQRGRQRRLIHPQGACGKLPYMSPEIYRNRQPFDGVAVDVWTAGTILFCMVTGNRSYQRPHSSDPQFYWMTHGLARLIQDWGVTLSDECLHLLQFMMQIDQRMRLTVEEVLDHPWFAHPDQPPPGIAPATPAVL
jgi:hypothetical protein